MQYRDLVQFDPIDSVIQLRNADDHTRAAELVSSYVISDRMAEQLTDIIFPQLQLDRPVDTKGLFVVGNYGTGKSHLMSVISALAEHRDLVPLVKNPAVKAAAEEVAGRFRVRRAEIGAVTRSLRDIVIGELEAFFEEQGTPFAFPSTDKLTNNKAPLIQAMTAFTKRYPDQGILFVLDELLDYLRGRQESELIRDLSFLRELGEVTGVTPFRFIAGIQETLFDNPRFQFVADSLRRVRDRFEQVRIARTDIVYVVSRRLLAKSPEQIARITTHLRHFTDLYPDLDNRLDEYAQLFPIHPSYIDTFERVYVAEKREVLQTFSKAMTAILDTTVPTEQTGLISFDHYWNVMRENPSLRTIPNIATVIDRSRILEGRIETGFTRPASKSMALRIIHALSVFRLTTEDLSLPIGLTVSELRDQLCLWTPMPERTAEFLEATILATMREILRTVSGQYISHNEGNGQYYLDVAKAVDFEAHIQQRAEMLDDATLNRAYFDVMQQLFEIKTDPHARGFRIWRWEVPWSAKKVTRPGYLFFGPPDERSTAQPPRDHYLFVLPLFDRDRMKRWVKMTSKADEVMFDVDGVDAEFEQLVRRYAATQALITDSSTHKRTYEARADEVLKKLLTWLQEQLPTRLRAIYAGKRSSVAEILARAKKTDYTSIKDLINFVAEQLLAPSFAAQYPDYPAFERLTAPVTEDRRPEVAQEALQAIGLGRPRNNLQRAVLDGLQLLGPDDTIRADESRYAQYFRQVLEAGSELQVINFSDVMEQVEVSGDPLYKDTHFHLEQHWVAVVLAALVYGGRIVIKSGGNRGSLIEADSLGQLATLPLADVAIFAFYRHPRGVPVSAWTLIFEGLGLNPALVRDDQLREQAVHQLQGAVVREAQTLARIENTLPDLKIWNTSIYSNTTLSADQSGFVVTASDEASSLVTLSSVDLLPEVRRAKTFFDDLARTNTPAKLMNLNRDEREITRAFEARTQALRLQDLIATIAELQPITAYLATAMPILGIDHPWSQRAASEQVRLLGLLRGFARGDGDLHIVEIKRRLDELQKAYISIYATLHRDSVLDHDGKQQVQRLQNDPRVQQLRELAGITFLPHQDLDRWQQSLSDIKCCTAFYEAMLLDHTTCPSCHFQPTREKSGTTPVRKLELAGERLDALVVNWHQALWAALQSEVVRASRDGMTAGERRPIDTYLESEQSAYYAHPLPTGFVRAANLALDGIQTVALAEEQLTAALIAGGMPCTADELHTRFTRFLERQLSGHRPQTTRFTITPPA